MAAKILVFDKKNRLSPKKIKVEKKWFLTPKTKNSDPLTYLDVIWSSHVKRNGIFSKKKFSDICNFFWTDNFIGKVKGAAFFLYFKKFHSKLANFFHVVFTCCAKQMSFYEVCAWNFLWCAFSKVGEVKKQFFLFFGIFCWYFGGFK